MATVSRRSEALQQSHQNPKIGHWAQQPKQQHQNQNQSQHQHQLRHLQQANYQHQPQHQQQSQQQQQQQRSLLQSPCITRMKRPLGLIDNLSDPLQAKKTRLTVEIFAKPLAQTLGSSKPILLKRRLSTPQPVQVASSHKPEWPSPIATIPLPPVPLSASVAAATTAPPTHQPATTTTTATATVTATVNTTKVTTKPANTTKTTATSKEHGLTRHREKVINGIRHELDRLQPSSADTSTATGPSGRKLRSQEATRFKSELSAYFPEYDEVIGNDPKEHHILNVDTPIIILDTEHAPSSPSLSSAAAIHTRPHLNTVRTYSNHLFTDLDNSQIVNFDYPETQSIGNELEDPLPDSLFSPAHIKAQRLEKSIRNTERGRAQHEKDRIIRLLGDLQGHDWLRTMGVNGVTESRRKSFEPARDHFIKGCQAILDKFRLWSQEEKRRKLERERALVAETDEEDEEDGKDDEDVNSDDGVDTDSLDDVAMVDVADQSGDHVASEGGEPLEDSDIDAAARQLLDEAMQRVRHAASALTRRSRGEPPPTVPEHPPREFTSFFAKRHQREAALNKGRRRGRTVLAWGHPIPEISESDFQLPEICLDDDTLKAHERRKRRDRRQRKQ
ncbi:hypothetical protein GGS21DRAFT_488649 [Xylaria nigripes]|nr:hypothetical protein GGS21DRAFT_488649 [Xylaria nigripes]